MNLSLRPFTARTFFTIAIPLFLIGITFATYYPSLPYEFQFDDIVNIKKYFYARTSSFSSLAFGSSRWISFWLNSIAYKLAKHDPFYYRLFNVICHIATGTLVYVFFLLGLSRLHHANFLYTRRLAIASLTALLFLLHPVQTQTVSYVIQGQLEGLATLFVMMLAVLFLLAHVRNNKIVQTALYVSMFIVGFISTGTKEIAIVSPLLVLLVDWFFVAQGSWKALQSRLLLHGAYMACILFWYKKYVFGNLIVTDSLKGKVTLLNNIGNVITPGPGQHITSWQFFISQFKVILHYMGMFIWPFNISVDYDWKMVSDFFSNDCLGPFLVLITLALAIAYLLYKRPTHELGFGLLWFFICLAPRSSFIPSTELVADYKTYMASVGYVFIFALMFVYAADSVVRWALHSARARTMYSSGLVACLTVFLCWNTYQRNTVWRSGEEFWYNIIQNSPKKARAYNNYAVALAEKNKFQEAIPYLRKAIKLDKNYPDPWNNMSVCYNHTGKVDLAINTMQEAIKINPNYPEFYNNLSSYFLTKKEYEKSLFFAQEAVKRRPYYGKAEFNWGRCLSELGKHEEALDHIRKACIECDYDTVEATRHYAQLAVRLNKFDHAVTALEQLHRLVPQDVETLFNLGTAYFFTQNYQNAATIFKSITESHPEELKSWFNLAESYMMLNKPDQALDCYNKAAPLQANFPEVSEKLAHCQAVLQKSRQRT